MAATVVATFYGNSATEPAGSSAETGLKFNLEDTETGTTPVTVPTATGTHFSYVKQVALKVTAGGGSTNISNRKVYQASTPTTGLAYHFLGSATYLDQTGGSGAPADSGSNGATPAGYTAMTGSPQTYDSASAAATNSTRNGNFCRLVLAVDNTYTGGAGSAVSLPDLKIDYDEA